MKYFYLFISIVFIFNCQSDGQQVPDDSFQPVIKNPAFSKGSGPVVFVDEAHENFHKIAERYRPFAKLLERDGYILKESKSKITFDVLNKCQIFVISVPTSKKKQSAFSKEEIQTLKDWVENGGSLLLLTDHMPDPPAIADLASAFGITVLNGYVLNEDPNESTGPVFFRKTNKTLAEHPITTGRKDLNEEINSITSFTGCAFQATSDFIPLMTLGLYKVSWMTKKEGKFPSDTPKINVEGWYQGGVKPLGKGKLAFFAEAGMFTAQIIAGKTKFGMNVPMAKENPQFLLNVFHWLSGILEAN
jgi:hypothetical protein